MREAVGSLVRRLRWFASVCASLAALVTCDSNAPQDTLTLQGGSTSGGTGGSGAPNSGAPNSGAPNSGGTTPMPACAGCEMDAVCHPDGDRNPSNACEHCESARNRQEWTAEPDGAACDDGRLCTVEDRCQAGRCEGTARDCSDGRACTAGEHCDERSGCVGGVSSCAEPLSCLASGECGRCESGQCTIENSCYSAGRLNSANPCQVCDPARTASDWSPLPDGTACSDALACTSGDACRAGNCQGMPQSCDDGVFCNGAETCVEASGSCATLSGTSPCATGCLEEETRCAAPCARPGVGCACDGAQGASCNGAAQKQRLVCEAGVWRRGASDCAPDQNCLNSTGACAPLAPECMGRSAGERVCRDGAVYSCGPDRVVDDLSSVESCSIGCEMSRGSARCVPKDSTVAISDVWPPSNARGGALLIVGRNFDNVTGFWFGGQTYPFVSLDPSVPGAQKLVVQVPSDAPPVATDLRLVTPAGLSEQVQILVERSDLGGAAAGPSEPYGIRPLKPDPDPQPIPTYPPISNFWVNECLGTDIYFLQEDSPADDGAAPANRRPLSQVQQDPAAHDSITGYLESTNLLLRMTVTTAGVSTAYVGAYSETGVDDVFRLVLFPETTPGRQLVLSVSPSGGPIPDLLNPDQCTL